ncbi:MAG: histidine kinase, partial [Kiritimatiellae bacterium]|nr:histidine kinase [Kiritimatiellia bacterium]
MKKPLKKSPVGKRESSMFAQRYQEGLRQYLQSKPSATLKTALDLGHQAVALGLDTLDLAMIHEQALLAQMQPVDTPAVRDRILKRAGNYFAEAILPLEETHRAAQEANAHLNQLNQALQQRTHDLATSNRQLKKEVARREVVEATLRRSKQKSGRLLEQSKQLQEELRLLSRRILLVQEEERKRISRELHDVIAQMLTGINVRLANLKIEATENTRGICRKISHTQQLVEKSVDDVHRFAGELRPALLDDLGLIPALQSFLKKFAKETGLKVSLKSFSGLEKLSNAKRTALYRVAQEALSNVARHAQASRVSICFERLPKGVCMKIKD